MHELSTESSRHLVPAAFAEKAMASLMQLHGELMDEKERRVDLFRRLMEKEQALAELKMYVKMLEEKLEPPEPKVELVTPPPFKAQVAPPPPTPPQIKRAVPPVPPRVAAARVPQEGWKSW